MACFSLVRECKSHSSSLSHFSLCFFKCTGSCKNATVTRRVWCSTSICNQDERPLTTRRCILSHCVNQSIYKKLDTTSVRSTVKTTPKKIQTTTVRISSTKAKTTSPKKTLTTKPPTTTTRIQKTNTKKLIPSTTKKNVVTKKVQPIVKKNPQRPG